MEDSLNARKKAQLRVWLIYAAFLLGFGLVIYIADLVEKLSYYAGRLALLENQISIMQNDNKKFASYDDLFKARNILDNSITTLQNITRQLTARSPSTIAGLDCTQQGFASVFLGAPQMILFVSCDDVTEYLEGYKVRLRIGNPHYVNLSDISGAISYYNNGESGGVDFKLTETIIAGTWQPITVTIPKATKEQMRSLSISLEAGTVFLNDMPRSR